MATLEDIITSKVRIKVLEVFFANPKEMYHVRGLVREVKEEINAVRRELTRLEKAGLLKKEPRGNRIYYWANKEYPLYGDLICMAAKTKGLGGEIISSKAKLGKPLFVMFSGKFARFEKRKKEDDVDVLVVGEVVLPELASLIRSEESKRGHEINYTVMSWEELNFRKKRRDPFIQSVLANSRVMVVGDEDALVS